MAATQSATAEMDLTLVLYVIMLVLQTQQPLLPLHVFKCLRKAVFNQLTGGQVKLVMAGTW